MVGTEANHTTSPARIPLWAISGAGPAWTRPEDHSDFDPLRGKQVFIWSGEHGYYWGPNKSGYFNKDGAGIYSFYNAYLYTSHCGPEKQIAFEIASSGITKLQFSQQCSWIAKNAAQWAGDVLTLSETVGEEIDLDGRRRFCAQIRKQLEIIENWGES